MRSISLARLSKTAIAADGDRAITQLNACIDTYNKVRDGLNVKP